MTSTPLERPHRHEPLPETQASRRKNVMLFGLAALALASIATLTFTRNVRAETLDAIVTRTHTNVPQYTLNWPSKLGKVNIFASLTPDQSKMTAMQTDVAKSTISLLSPFQETQRVYFFLKPVDHTPGLWVSNRVLPLEGVANFRDLGGYETNDHHHVRWGQFYRSAAPNGLTTEDFAQVDFLGIKSVTDLRTREERQRQPTHWQGSTPAPTFFSSDKLRLPAYMTDRTRLANLDEKHAKALMEEFYANMPEYYAPELKALFGRLLTHQTPTLTHCTSGKDRTGFASALILYALGVPENTILADYSLSGDLLRDHVTPSFKAAMAAYQKGGTRPSAAAIRAMQISDPAYLKAAFDSIRTHYGSIDTYLTEKLGVGPVQRASLRAYYLD